MRKIILYTASSLNGKIARANGQVDWLDSIQHPEDEDYGYAKFYDRIDTTIMGNNTYKEVLGFGVEFPYKGKANYVFTRNTQQAGDENVTYVCEEVINFAQQLKEKKGKDIWLIGGGQLNTLLLNAGLIDEIYIHIMPITIPDGIEVFEGAPIEKQFNLISSRSFESGVVELRYMAKQSH